MEKFSGQQIEKLLIEKKREKGELKDQADCMHRDIVKCYLNGKAHRYVCMECGFADKSRAAFFSYPQSDRQMG